MGLETSVTYISDLNPQFPTETDALMQGDNHIRNVKQALRATFPNVNAPVTPTPAQINKLASVTVSAAEINTLAGLDGNVASLIADLAASAALALDQLIPVGTVLEYAGNTLPSGGNWQWADGGELNRLEFATLFARTGTSHGAGNGTTTFNKPDRRGRVGIGAGSGPSLSARALGVKGGAERVTLTEGQMPAHNHWFEAWTSVNGHHDHAVNSRSGASGGGNYEPEPFEESGTRSTGRTDGNGNHNHYISATTNTKGNNESHDNMQPFIAMNYIVRVK